MCENIDLNPIVQENIKLRKENTRLLELAESWRNKYRDKNEQYSMLRQANAALEAEIGVLSTKLQQKIDEIEAGHSPTL